MQVSPKVASSRNNHALAAASAATEHCALFRDPFLRIALPLALLPPIIFALLNFWWWWQCPPAMVYLGYLQGDQPTYTALARAVLNRGNGLFYANPFDYNPEAPRVLTNLGYVVLGWLIRLVGGRTVLAWEVWRLVFGGLCYGLFALLVARLFSTKGLRWLVFGAGTFGAGAAWVLTLAIALSRPQWGWLRAFVEAEKGYDWWCLNLFRQSLYPLELAYHSLFLAALLTCLDRHYRLLLLVIFLLWWTHPVTALLTTTVVGLVLVSDWRRERGRRERLALLGLGCVVLPWVLYYRLFLPTFPAIHSWIEQTLSFHFVLRLSVWPRAWGVLLVGPAAALLYTPLRHYLVRERTGRLILFWGLAAFVLVHNNLFLNRPVQPMHFTRGYIHLFLLIVTAKGLELALSKYRHPPKRWRAGKWLAIGLLPLMVVDNALFVARVAMEQPQPGLLTIPRDAKEVLDYFGKQPGNLGVLSVDRLLGVLIVAHTPHRVFLSEAVFTPFFSERTLQAGRILRSGDIDATRQWRVERVVLMKVRGAPYPDWVRVPERFRVLLQNRLYTVGELAKTPDEQ